MADIFTFSANALSIASSSRRPSVACVATREAVEGGGGGCRRWRRVREDGIGGSRRGEVVGGGIGGVRRFGIATLPEPDCGSHPRSSSSRRYSISSHSTPPTKTRRGKDERKGGGGAGGEGEEGEGRGRCRGCFILVCVCVCVCLWWGGGGGGGCDWNVKGGEGRMKEGGGGGGEADQAVGGEGKRRRRAGREHVFQAHTECMPPSRWHLHLHVSDTSRKELIAREGCG